LPLLAAIASAVEVGYYFALNTRIGAQAGAASRSPLLLQLTKGMKEWV